MILTFHYTNTDVGMNHIEVLMEPKYMSKSLTQALTTLSAFALNHEGGEGSRNCVRTLEPRATAACQYSH